ncbi:CinA family protein [Corynebacterium sp. UMB8791]
MRGTASDVIAELTKRDATVGLCESLTAGLASAALAGVPGASAALRGAMVTYATECKVTLAGVPQDVIDEFGPVSPVTAKEMAKAARRKLNADWGLSLTGVAGPSEQDGHPVGEVWVGIASSDDCEAVLAGDILSDAPLVRGTIPGFSHARNLLQAPRNEVREWAVEAALRVLLHAVREQKHVEGSYTK